jgi:hypothetical protein
LLWRMVEPDRLCIDGPKQRLPDLALRKVVQLVICEEPNLGVPEAGTDDPLRGSGDDDACRVSCANSVVGLPQNVTPDC